MAWLLESSEALILIIQIATSSVLWSILGNELMTCGFSTDVWIKL